MQKLVRVLIIYTAITVTLLLVNTLLSIRSSTEQNKKAETTIDSLKQNLEEITAYQQSQKEIVQKLDKLKSQTDSENKQVLGTSNQASDSSKPTSGFVTINDKKWQTVDVYESNSYSSKVINKVEFDKVYRYLKKDGSWYQIVLPASQRGEPKTDASGWIAGRFLREVADNGPQ